MWCRAERQRCRAIAAAKPPALTGAFVGSADPSRRRFLQLVSCPAKPPPCCVALSCRSRFTSLKSAPSRATIWLNPFQDPPNRAFTNASKIRVIVLSPDSLRSRQGRQILDQSQQLDRQWIGRRTYEGVEKPGYIFTFRWLVTDHSGFCRSLRHSRNRSVPRY